MKKLIPAITAAMLLLCVCIAFYNQNEHKGEAVLSIKNSKTRYTFKASFYAGIKPEVTRYVDSCANILRNEISIFVLKSQAAI